LAAQTSPIYLIRSFSCVQEKNSVTAHTSVSAVNIDCTEGTAFQSIDAGKRDTRPQYRKYSNHARRCKTICRLCGASSHTGGTGCAGSMGHGLAQGRDPQRTRPRRGSCPAIMAQSVHAGLLLSSVATGFGSGTSSTISRICGYLGFSLNRTLVSVLSMEFCCKSS
jgi:hypothetical protein